MKLLKPFKISCLVALLAVLFSSTGAVAQIKITSPLNSSTLIFGRVVKIEWEGAGSLPVSLYYSTNNGTSWDLIEDELTGNVYEWTLPKLAEKNILLKAEVLKKFELQKLWEVNKDDDAIHTTEIRSASLSPDGKYILATDRGSEFRLWDIERKSANVIRLPAIQSIYSSVFFHSTARLAFAADSCIIVCTDLFTPGFKTIGKGEHKSFIRSIAVHPTKEIIASASEDGYIRIFDFKTGELLKTFHEPNFAAYSIAFSNDGASIAYAGDNFDLYQSRVYVRRWEDPDQVKILEGHGKDGENRTIWKVNFSPDNSQIISCGVDNSVRIWKLSDTKEEFNLKGNKFHVRSARFSPDGKHCISGSLDSSLRQWESKTGKEYSGVGNHGGQILAVDYSPTGDTILSAGRDRSIKLWKNVQGGFQNSVISAFLQEESIKIFPADTTIAGDLEGIFIETPDTIPEDTIDVVIPGDTVIVRDTVCAADLRTASFGEKTMILATSPNPAKDIIKITFTLAEDGVISLKIIDMQGNLVKTFFAESLKSGRYERDLNLAGIPNGVYILRLETRSQAVDAQISIVK
jgi:WD40 repeat protein